MTIVLVRHAHPVIPTVGGPDDLHRPLTEDGLADAAALAPRLAALGPARIVSSPYLRAVRTVRPAAELLGLPVETDWELREWDSGLAPGPDYARHYASSWANPDLVRPGGESLRHLSDRALGALRPLLDGPGPVVVGSHGTFISRTLAGFGYPVDWPFHRSMPMPAVYVLHFAAADAAPRVTGPGIA